MSVRTVKVSNVSLGASEQDIKEFFSFSGDIDYVEMQSGDEWSQVAYVTFKDSQGAETALLLSGATIVDLSVIITPATDYKLPAAAAAAAPAYKDTKQAEGSESAVQKAEDVVSSMLAKGFILGKDAVTRAKSFDEKIGLSEKITMGTSAVNEKVKEMDQKFQVSEKTKSAFAAAEQKVSNAGSAIMKNRYVFTSASWVTGAFSKVAKAASDMGNNIKEKVVAEEGEPDKGPEADFARVHLSDAPKAAGSGHPSKPPPAQGLIL
ncbi:binding partner of ACD11 1-like isoform X2 [Iris pallida]|uniref:Binding partner of ACD11 1-like isoform X2 n=1 Tax=Iris pallida TaxID=29817 RepID=A0AAX6FCJ4_IRIPA|nr:binding partner of ACD11 1-like isoform X2 [Iris pallida]